MKGKTIGTENGLVNGLLEPPHSYLYYLGVQGIPWKAGYNTGYNSISFLNLNININGQHGNAENGVYNRMITLVTENKVDLTGTSQIKCFFLVEKTIVKWELD